MICSSLIDLFGTGESEPELVKAFDFTSPESRIPSPELIFYGQASRPISTGQLSTLLYLHTRPINVVVYNGPSGVVTPRDI